MFALAVTVFAGLTTVALALPSACPPATHASGTVCVSDGTHPAPSTPSRTIPDYSMSRDPRMGVRVAIALTGSLLAAGFLWVARRQRRPAHGRTI